MKRKKGSNVCEICRYKCVRRDHMTQHMLVHSDQRLFVCPVDGCELDFKRKDHLVRHVKLKHNVGEQPNVCSTSFDSNSALRLTPQAEFPTEAAGSKTSESDMKRTILELREENARLQRELVAEREKYREDLERWSKDLDSSATKSKSLELTVETHELRTYHKKKGRSPIVLAQHSASASEPTDKAL